MARKTHLENTSGGGPVCQRGRIGGQLRGEHITSKFDDFVREWADLRCSRCENSKLFAFLQCQAAKVAALQHQRHPRVRGCRGDCPGITTARP